MKLYSLADQSERCILNVTLWYDGSVSQHQIHGRNYKLIDHATRFDTLRRFYLLLLFAFGSFTLTCSTQLLNHYLGVSQVQTDFYEGHFIFGMQQCSANSTFLFIRCHVQEQVIPISKSVCMYSGVQNWCLVLYFFLQLLL